MNPDRKDTFHFVVCGTSLYSNYARKHGDMPDYMQRGSIKISTESIELLKEFLGQAPELNSAEVNSMLKFGLEKIDRIYLLHTDTDLGELCARALEKWLKEKGEFKEIIRVRIQGFGSNFETGLVNLRNRVIDFLKRNKGKYEFYLNCTGGFKPESAMLVLIASIFDIPAYYIYETSRTLVNIPPIPRAGNSDIVDALKDIPDSGLVGLDKARYREKWMKKKTRNGQAIFDYLEFTGLIIPGELEEDRLKISPLGRMYLDNLDAMKES